MILTEKVLITFPHHVFGTSKAVPLGHRLVHQLELRFPVLEIDIQGDVINEQPHEMTLLKELLLYQLPRRNINHRPRHPNRLPLGISNDHTTYAEPVPFA